MLICAGLANGVSTLTNIGDCEDISATVDCLRAMGIEIAKNGSTVTVKGGLPTFQPISVLPCRESGSTLRFLIPLAMKNEYPTTFTCEGRLPERPQTVYEEIAKRENLVFLRDGANITVGGKIHAGEYHVAGNISSQFITGLLFVLPLLDGDSKIKLLPPVESRSYIDLTLDVLHRFGIKADWTDDVTLSVAGGQTYTPCDCEAEGDWSGGAFFEALGRLDGNSVTVTNLNPTSRQGDKICVRYLDELQSGRVKISLADCPDLGPILFTFAGLHHGGIFTDVERLRIKESDRIATMREELAKCGIEVLDRGNEVEICTENLHAPNLAFEGHNDHRIVMSLAILATVTGGTICGIEAVRKSYPNFFEDLSSLGINLQLI